MNALSALANGAVWGCALAGCVWLALRVTPRCALPASARFGLWWITLVAVLLLPLAALRTPTQRVTALQLVQVERAAITVPHIERIPAQPQPARPWRIPVTEGSWVVFARAVWFGLAAILLLRLALGFAAMTRARGRARIAPDPWPTRVPRWLAAVRAGSRRASLCASDDISIPAAAGLHRPAILIPARLFEDFGFDDLECVCLHEAAHLARRDDYALLVQRIFEAALWPHPAVRLIARQLDLEREIACDDRVVNATGEPCAYAACLTHVLETCGAASAGFAAPAMAGTRSGVSRRIRLLLDRRAAAPRWRVALAAAVPLAFVALALVKAPAVVAVAKPPALPAVTLVSELAGLPAPVVRAEEKPMNRKMKPIVHAVALAAAAAVSSTAAAPVPDQTAPTSATQQAAGADLRYVNLQQIAIYLPVGFLNSSALERAITAAHKFVAERRPQSVVAIICFDGTSARVLQDFTGDAGKLDAALDRVAAPSSYPLFSPTADEQLAALDSVVHVLGPLAGKKLLVYFADGQTIQAPSAQTEKVINSAIRANVALYFIDANRIVERKY